MDSSHEKTLYFLFDVLDGNYEKVNKAEEKIGPLLREKYNLPVTKKVNDIELKEIKYRVSYPTLLHIAVFDSDKIENSEGRGKIIDLLLEKGANVGATENEQDDSVLHSASVAGNLSVVKKILAKKPNIDAVNIRGETPIHYAAMFGHIELLEELINQGANVNLKTNDHSNLLHVLSKLKDPKKLEQIAKKLIDCGVDINEENKEGKSALDLIKETNFVLANKLETYVKEHSDFFTAIMQNDYQKVEDILQNNKRFLEIQTIDNHFLVYPLHLAVIRGNEKMVDLLLKFNANIDQKDREGNTPLMYAAGFGHESIFKKLFSHQENISIKNYSDHNLMHFAVVSNNTEIIELVSKQLVKQGLDLNEKSGGGNTPLHIAVQHKNMQAAKKLFVLGVSISLQDNSGRTPLHVAVLTGNSDMVKALIDKGADLNFQDKEGKTPLHLAAEKGFLEIAQILLSAGALTNRRDEYGRTPLSRAATKGYLHIMHEIARKLPPESRGEHLFQIQSQAPLFLSASKHPVFSLIDQGTILMKTFHFAEAKKMFEQAAIEIKKDPKYSSNERLKKRISNYINKSELLIKKTLTNPLEFGTSLDTPGKIMSHIIGLDPAKFSEMREIIEKMLKEPLLKPILDYISMYFMLNEKTNILISDSHSEKEASGSYRNSTVYIRRSDPKESADTLMHELSHFYFNKVYHNSARPYPKNDPEREKEFEQVIKEVMINFYNTYYQSEDNEETKAKINQMTSFQIGRDLFNRIQEKKTIFLMLTHIEEILLSVYTGHYPQEMEATEFVVRLPQLIAIENRTGENFESIFKPLSDYYEKHLIPDAKKFCNDISIQLEDFSKNTIFSLKK